MAAGSVTLTMTEAGVTRSLFPRPAGSVEFTVTNESGLKGEFEVISSAPEILTEEFLEDGASGTFTVGLQPGQYQVICGAPSNTRADLVVTGEGEAGTVPQVDQADLDAAVTDYQSLRARTDRSARRRTPSSSPTLSAPATSKGEAALRTRCGCRGSRSSRSPSSSPTLTA